MPRQGIHNHCLRPISKYLFGRQRKFLVLYLLNSIHLANASADDTGRSLSLDRENIVIQRGLYVVHPIDNRAAMPQVINRSRSDVG